MKSALATIVAVLGFWTCSSSFSQAQDKAIQNDGLFIDLQQNTLTPEERLSLGTIDQKSHVSIESKREKVLKIESLLVNGALDNAKASKSEVVLNSELQKVSGLIKDTGVDLDPTETVNRITTYVDGEHWTLVGTHRFTLLRSLLRSQGITTDRAGHYWFSSAASLLKTDSIWGASTVLHLFPIPPDLAKLKDNHIGDIDYADGKIYAPIEDGPAYKNPYVGIYDASTLKLEKYYRLPQGQQRDGVPWFTVDSKAGLAYSAEYSNVTKINVYKLSDMTPMGQITMSDKLDAIQGSKVVGGMLYMTANDKSGKGHAIFKLNLATGTVIQVAGPAPADLIEVEGLTFNPTAGGDQIEALGVVPYGGALGQKLHLRKVELNTYRIDHPSLRAQFLQNINSLNQ